MEGVMMRGERSAATAVRAPDGRIELETSRLSEEKKWWQKVPVLRGFLNFFMMLVFGSKVLTRSAEVYGEDLGERNEDEENPANDQEKNEEKPAKKGGVTSLDVAIIIGVILGVAFAIGLFVALPLGIVALLEHIPSFGGIHYVWRNLIVSGIRLIILLGYLFVISLIPDIKRVFMYHGAEHKVITCFEQGEELTVENARKMSRLHDRCGTSFLVITVFISLIAGAFLPTFDTMSSRFVAYLLRFLTRLALLPVVAGVSYEVLKGLAKFDNAFVRVLKKPGLWFQLLTTREPTDQMLEVSLTSFKAVQQMDADPLIAPILFNEVKPYKAAHDEIAEMLSSYGEVEANAMTDWIFVKLLNCDRWHLLLVRNIKAWTLEQAKAYARRAAAGEPLQYALGETEFCGVKIKCDPRALIPRGDTELLVQEAVAVAKEGARVLDVCTGSGAVAIAMIHETECLYDSVTATDVDEAALSLAEENAKLTHCRSQIDFVHSDLLASVEGVFDVITANPPYIPTAEIDKLDENVRREPRIALDGGADGLDFYRRLAVEIPPHLAKGGVLLLEIGADQAAAVTALFASLGTIEVIKDVEGHDRVVKVTENV